MKKRKRKKRRKRCRYYVNTNFFVDLDEGKREAIELAKRNRGALCTSTVLVYEYRQYGIGYVAKRLARRYGIRVYKLAVLTLLEEASSIAGPSASANTVFDYAHILAAKRIGAKTFVTSDKASCRRAIRLGLCCLNHRSGETLCPTQE